MPNLPQRTGIYHVQGEIKDLKIVVKLKCISEWMPLPKFEYLGANPAQANVSRNTSLYDDTGDSCTNPSWSTECSIFMPCGDQSNGYTAHCPYYKEGSYYNYYEPSTRYSYSHSSGFTMLSSTPPTNFYDGDYEQSSDRSYIAKKSCPWHSKISLESNATSRETTKATLDNTELWISDSASQSESPSANESEGAELSERSEQTLSSKSGLLSSCNLAEDFFERNQELCSGSTAKLIIGWQEKHFSRIELAHYCNRNNCLTSLHRRFHRWTRSIIEMQLRREFEQQDTYARELISQRKHQAARQTKSKRKSKKGATQTRRCTSSPLSPKAAPITSQSERPFKGRAHRKAAQEEIDLSNASTVNAVDGSASVYSSDYNIIKDEDFAIRTCLIHTLIDVDDKPTEAKSLHNKGFQVMYVYADLMPDTLIISMRYSPSSGLLYVEPDFSFCAEDLNYKIEITGGDCPRRYAYGFHCVSPLQATCNCVDRPLSAEFNEEAYESFEEPQSQASTPEPPDDTIDEDNASVSSYSSSVSISTIKEQLTSTEKLLLKYKKQRAEAIELRTLQDFTMPPKRMRRVVLLMQLHQAKNFEYSNVHVRYYVHMPPNTILETNNPEDPVEVRGSTPTSRGGGSKRIASFSHCWEISLLCEEQFDPKQLLHIYFEVISMDSWHRERCEGYAHFSCSLLEPLSNPAEPVELQCVRPRGNWLDALNRYFIGGRKVFDFVKYFNNTQNMNHEVPPNEESPLNSRVTDKPKESAMRTTGAILFSMQKIQQGPPDGQTALDLQLGDDAVGDNNNDTSSKNNNKVPSTTTLDEILTAYVEARDRVKVLLRCRSKSCQVNLTTE